MYVYSTPPPSPPTPALPHSRVLLSPFFTLIKMAWAPFLLSLSYFFQFFRTISNFPTVIGPFRDVNTKCVYICTHINVLVCNLSFCCCFLSFFSIPSSSYSCFDQFMLTFLFCPVDFFLTNIQTTFSLCVCELLLDMIVTLSFTVRCHPRSHF